MRHTTLALVLTASLALLVPSLTLRLYVIDDEEKPIGVVTCTDVLRKLVEVSVQQPSPSASQSH